MDAILGLRMSCAATVATQAVATQKAMTSAAKLQTRNIALLGNMMATRGNCVLSIAALIRAAKTKLRCERGRIAPTLPFFMIMRARRPVHTNLKRYWNHDVVKGRQIPDIASQQTCLANI